MRQRPTRLSLPRPSPLERSFLLCRENGVDLNAARSALLGGFAQSKILDQHGLRMIEEDFQPGGTAINQLKDLVEASKVASADSLNLPMLETNKKLWGRMLEDGLGELTTAACTSGTGRPWKKNGERMKGHRHGSGWLYRNSTRKRTLPTGHLALRPSGEVEISSIVAADLRDSRGEPQGFAGLGFLRRGGFVDRRSGELDHTQGGRFFALSPCGHREWRRGARF